MREVRVHHPVAPRILVRRRPSRAWACVGSVALAVLVGCSPTEPTPPPPPTTDVQVRSPTEAVSSGTVKADAGGLGFEDLEGSRQVPGREWAQIMRDCLAENGWDVVIPADDPAALEHHGAADQNEAYMEDFVRCSNANDISPDPPTFDEDSADRAWQEYNAAAVCMAEHGYDPPQPPSRERFLAEQLQGGSSWNPHAVPTGEESVAAAAIAACPISNDYILFGIRYPDD